MARFRRQWKHGSSRWKLKVLVFKDNRGLISIKKGSVNSGDSFETNSYIYSCKITEQLKILSEEVSEQDEEKEAAKHHFSTVMFFC